MGWRGKQRTPEEGTDDGGESADGRDGRSNGARHAERRKLHCRGAGAPASRATGFGQTLPTFESALSSVRCDARVC